MICIDASVAIKWVVNEPDSRRALLLSNLALGLGHQLVAPWIMPFEVTNALLRRCLRNGIEIADARERLEEFFLVPVELMHWDTIHDEALELSEDFSLTAAYDAHYLALARREQCELWTADRRLLNAAGGRFPFLRDLALFDDGSIRPIHGSLRRERA